MRYSQEDDYNDDDESKFDDKENFFDHDDFDDFDDLDELELMDRRFDLEKQKIKIIEIGLKQQYLRRKLLLDAIHVSQKSFWWNFFSFKTKVKWITNFYEIFVDLVLGIPSEDDYEKIEDENILEDEEI